MLMQTWASSEINNFMKSNNYKSIKHHVSLPHLNSQVKLHNGVPSIYLYLLIWLNVIIILNFPL